MKVRKWSHDHLRDPEAHLTALNWEILTGEYAKEKLIWMRLSNTNEGQAPNNI